MTAKKYYIIMKNGDFTEGRDPMGYHSLWTDGEEAHHRRTSCSGVGIMTEQYVITISRIDSPDYYYNADRNTWLGALREAEATRYSQQQAQKVANVMRDDLEDRGWKIDIQRVS